MARGKMTLFQGDPGVGKSYASLAIAAELSRAGKRVLILQVEDGLSDTTVPRLQALGADLSLIRAFPIQKAPVLNKEGLAVLEKHLADWQPYFVSIDPVTYFIGAEVDMHRANEVRSVLARLAALAEVFDCAIAPIIHMNKGAAKAIYRALGSIDFTASVRSVLLFGRIEDEPERGSAVFHIKCNYGRKEEPLGFDITDAGFAWQQTDLTLAEVEGRKTGPKPVKMKAARTWLIGLLATGPRDGAEVKALAADEEITDVTLRRAADSLFIVKERQEGSNLVLWRLPPILNPTGGSPDHSTGESPAHAQVDDQAISREGTP